MTRRGRRPRFRSVPWFVPRPWPDRRRQSRYKRRVPPSPSGTGASMVIVSILAFFVLTFLLASIAVAISWMAFLKTKAEETEAEQGELGVDDEDRPLMRTERLSTINFWDKLL